MKYYLLLLAVVVGFSSCEEFENSATASSTTYLPFIEVFGESSVELDCNNTGGYTDAGAEAREGGEVITLNTEIVGTYFGSDAVDVPDSYAINYSATNVDGIPGLDSRSVIWPACNSDLVTGLEGMYTAAVFRTRYSNGTTVDYSDAEHGPYWVVDLGGGKYGFSCGIGQFYEYGYGYGPAYSGTGMVITANNIATDDFTVSASNGVGAFEGNLVFSNIVVDEVAKTISWSVDWDFGDPGVNIDPTYAFDVVLTQVAD